VSVEGSVHPRFVPVRDEFVRSFSNGSETGAGLSVWHDGEHVVDLWGGIRDRERQLPYEADTLSTFFSVTKGMTAICFLMLADRGLFDYDAPLSTYWPAFAASDKQTITGRMFLSHRSGLLGFRERITLDHLDGAPDELTAILERTRPVWTPGAHQGYHAVSYGLYAAELFRRITGESIGTFFRREVSGPLKADVYLGLPEALESRVAKMYPLTHAERLTVALPDILIRGGAEARILMSVLRKGDSLLAFAEPHDLGASGIDHFNTRRVHAMELPWANGLGSARGLCRVYAALANGGSLDGVTLVRPELLAPLMERQSWSSRDRVLNRPMGWSLGFVKEDPGVFSTHSTTSFGHPGIGGMLGWCDPERKLAIGYLTVKMAHQVRSPRALSLCRIIDACVGSA
jgi:CubicO group peptidase (beta-lactamase class C family)